MNYVLSGAIILFAFAVGELVRPLARRFAAWSMARMFR